jgi:protein-disulfide isomerase
MRRKHLFFSLSLVLGATACDNSNSHTDHGSEGAKLRVDVERYKVDLREDDYALGGQAPLVTIVIFSDYACGPCGVLWQIMKNLHEDYGDDIRIVHRGIGIAGFKDGERAAEAAYAAGAQGKFWSMHWRLFTYPDDFSAPALRAHATALGLDLAKFEADLEQGVHVGRRLQERRQATTLGVNAAPIVFVNGMALVGPKPDEAMWHTLLDGEIKSVRGRIASGIPRPELYASLQAGALVRPLPKPKAVTELREETDAAKPKVAEYDYSTVKKPDRHQRYAVPLDGAARRGSENAAVTIVEFVDFQCPVCRKQHRQSMLEMRERFDGQIAFVTLNLPLEMHREARPAAIAAMAAGRQGRYWDFHDRFFKGGMVFERSKYIELAMDLGLDADKFTADLSDGALHEQIEKDRLVSYKLGVTATPTMFVNGIFIEGFAGPTSLAALIESEIALAKETGGGSVPDNYYNELMAAAIQEQDFPNVGKLASSTPPQP